MCQLIKCAIPVYGKINEEHKKYMSAINFINETSPTNSH